MVLSGAFQQTGKSWFKHDLRLFDLIVVRIPISGDSQGQAGQDLSNLIYLSISLVFAEVLD